MNERHPLHDIEGWKRLSPLFDQLLETQPERRHEWLAALRVRDNASAERLADLLAAHERLDADGFLEHPAQDSPDIGARAGRQVGAYRLLEPLGFGGMGTVWLAERCDGRFEGKAAVKLLHDALLRPGDHERFRREASALARLSHPHISRLVDAGVADGQPFLVLDYVDGRRIDEACEIAGLDVHARLRLGLQVLDAVAHAHTRLVLHRDIKPSNVLVDGDGAAKLIDFGIARLVTPDDISATEFDVTGEFGRAFTPRFGAPEQLAGQPVSTTTDVYSIGLLLYVLLAGENPREHVSPADVSTAVLPPASAVAARTGRPDRARALKGDLDNILAKAVRSQPAERYATAGAFADDLRRYLAGEPVTARPDALTYRMRKFIGRHRLAVGAATVAIVGIVALAAVATVQRREALTQRTRAVARGAAAYAVAQASARVDRALLLGVEAVGMHTAPETTTGLLTALDAARHLVRFRNDLGAVDRFTVSPDRQHALTIDRDGLLRRFSLPDWRLVAERATGLRDVHSVLFTGDSRRLLAGSFSGGRLLDAETLAFVGSNVLFTPPGQAPEAIFDIDREGTTVVVAEYVRGRAVQVYDARTGAVMATIQADRCAGINMPLVLPQRWELVLACMNGVFVYDLRTGALVRERPSGPVGTAHTDPLGRRLLLAPWDNQPVVIDAISFEEVMPPLPIPGGRVYLAVFASHGDAVAIGTDTGNIAVWDVPRKRELARFGALDQGISSLEWGKDAFTIERDGRIEGAARLLVGTADGVTEWDLTQTAGLGPASRPKLPAAQALAATHDVEQAVYYAASVAGDPSPGIDVHAVDDQRVLRTLQPGIADAVPLAVSANGRRLVVSQPVSTSEAAGAPFGLSVIDTTRGDTVAQLPLPPAPTSESRPGAAAQPSARAALARISPNGQLVVAWTRGMLVAWSADTGKTVASAEAAIPPSAMAFSADGRHFAVSRDGRISVLDPASLRTRHTHELKDTPSVKHLFGSAALGGIVFTSEGGEVGVIDPATGSLSGPPFRAGGSQLQTAAISPDGRLLAATSSDGAVRVWDVVSRLPIGPPLRGHPAGRSYPHIWFSGPNALSTYVSGTRIDWNLDATVLATATCARVGRALSELEWRQYVGDEPYRPSCRPR